MEVEVTNMRSRTTYILLFRNGIFLDRSNEREEGEDDRRGRQALRIFLFQVAILPSFGTKEGFLLGRGGKESYVLSSAFCLVFPKTDTKWFYTPTRYAGLFVCLLLFSVLFPLYSDSKVTIPRMLRDLLVNYFLRDFDCFSRREKEIRFVKNP